MRKIERLVFFYDLAIVAESRTFKAPKPISIRKAFDLMEIVPLEQRIKDMSKGREQLYVSDWKWDGDICNLAKICMIFVIYKSKSNNDKYNARP